jgi:hypothetical protein
MSNGSFDGLTGRLAADLGRVHRQTPGANQSVIERQ